MTITNNQYLIFIIVNFIYLFGVTQSGHPFATAPFNSNYTIIIFSILLLLNFGLFYALKLDTKDNFTFEVSPGKRCLGGEYMRSSNPELQKFCSELPPEEIKRYQCPYSTTGYPIYLNRDEMSDAKWENNMCKNLGGGVPPQFEYMYS